MEHTKRKTIPFEGSLALTKSAIEAYDELDAQFQTTLGIAESVALMHRLERLGEAVGAAFGEDTKSINNPDTCRGCIRPGPKVPGPGCELSFVRRMVKAWEERTAAAAAVAESERTSTLANGLVDEWEKEVSSVSE